MSLLISLPALSEWIVLLISIAIIYGLYRLFKRKNDVLFMVGFVNIADTAKRPLIRRYLFGK